MPLVLNVESTSDMHDGEDTSSSDGGSSYQRDYFSRPPLAPPPPASQTMGNISWNQRDVITFDAGSHWVLLIPYSSVSRITVQPPEISGVTIGWEVDGPSNSEFLSIGSVFPSALQG